MYYKPTIRTGLTIGLLALSVSIGGCASWKPHRPVQVQEKEWTSSAGITGTQLLTDHYDIRVTARDEILRQYLAPFMETTFIDYRKLMPSPAQAGDRLVIYTWIMPALHRSYTISVKTIPFRLWPTKAFINT